MLKNLSHKKVATALAFGMFFLKIVHQMIFLSIALKSGQDSLFRGGIYEYNSEKKICQRDCFSREKQLAN
jgi:hypothetical protein